MKKKRKTRPMSAAVLLRAEASRLEVLAHGMPAKALPFIMSNVRAFNLAAAFLDALGAPERLERYLPAEE